MTIIRVVLKLRNLPSETTRMEQLPNLGVYVTEGPAPP